MSYPSCGEHIWERKEAAWMEVRRWWEGQNGDKRYLAGHVSGESSPWQWECSADMAVVPLTHPGVAGQGHRQRCEHCSRSSGDQGLNQSALIHRWRVGIEPGAFWKASVGHKHTEKHTLQTQQPVHKQIGQIGAELSVCVSCMRLKFCIILGYKEGSLGEIVCNYIQALFQLWGESFCCSWGPICATLVGILCGCKK